MLRSFLRVLAGSCAVLLAVSANALAEPEQFQIGHDIHVAAGQRTGDVTCLNCSVYIRGQVEGDAVALNGDIVLESGGQLAGDVTTIHGDVRVADGAQIAGDASAIAGDVRKQPSAAIAGDVTSLSGAGWLLLVFLVPLAALGVIIALVIWLVQRSRRPVGVPVRT